MEYKYKLKKNKNGTIVDNKGKRYFLQKINEEMDEDKIDKFINILMILLNLIIIISLLSVIIIIIGILQ